MDKIRNIILNNQDKLKLIIMFGAILAAFSCVSRPDFNFVGYLYTYYIWFIYNTDRVISFFKNFRKYKIKKKLCAFFI